jgi:hypothetical protein
VRRHRQRQGQSPATGRDQGLIRNGRLRYHYCCGCGVAVDPLDIV